VALRGRHVPIGAQVVVASTWWGEGAELMLDDNPTVEERRAVRRAYRAW
jgi:hypothetical protein